MKVSILPILAASAGLLANASPLRVILVSSSVHQLSDGPVAQRPPVFNIHNAVPAPARGGCGGLRQKASSFASAFRLALGFSAKGEGEHKMHLAHPRPEIMMHPAPPRPVQPLPFIGMPDVEGKTPGGDRLRIISFPVPAPAEPHRAHGHFHHKSRHSFFMRVHFALMSLGPWEGRAVAFVLGCGIGVLLRMVWVLSLLALRAVRASCPYSSSSSSSCPYADNYILVAADAADADAEELAVAAPQYTVAAAYPAEKVAIVEEERK